MAAIEKEVNLYICDPDKNKDCKKTYCYYNKTGECKHTKNPKHARAGTMPIKCKEIQEV